MTRSLFYAATALALGIVWTGPGKAQDWQGHDRRGSDYRHDERGAGPGEHWRDRDIQRFHERDFEVWRGGQWFHGRHEDRLGWWWIVGGVWYFYPEPVYPYPDPYRPPVVTAPTPPGTVYYYCPSPPGYYPYLPACPSGWQIIRGR